MAVNQFHIAAISEHFRGATGRQKKKTADLPLDERLAKLHHRGHEGRSDRRSRPQASEGAAPLDIINGPLMAGMSEVGRLFNNNELIVAEVLQSAEAMKAAVNHLEQFMEKAESSARGKIVLATVKGDVHDIGKNLVEIILSNNGYHGRQSRHQGAARRADQSVPAARPDAIGLSGLLVKSAQQMVITAGDLKDAGINVPLLVGGAALSEKFTKTKIGPNYAAPTFYAKDAMTGLRLMNEIMDPELRETRPVADTSSETFRSKPRAPEQVGGAFRRGPQPQSSHGYSDSARALPGSQASARIPHLTEIWSYINPFMLYGRHLGFKGNFEKLLAERDPKALELFHNLEEVKHEAATFMKRPRRLAIFRSRAGREHAAPVSRRRGTRLSRAFHFGRQAKSDGLCLSDYALDPQDGRRDHIALFVVTAGEGVIEQSEEAKSARRILQSACAAGSGDRNCRGLRRVASSPHSRRLGISGSAYV